MSDSFQRLFMRSEPEILPLTAQTDLAPVMQPGRSQFSLLVGHFLERSFSRETGSADDAKARLILIAFVTALPSFVIASYLWFDYHPFPGWPPGHPGSPPTYWLQINHHLFFLLYSFVAMGIIAAFKWDMYFPDSLDVLVLTTLPISDAAVFRARVATIAIFIASFLFATNILTIVAFPMAVGPSNMSRFVAGHLLATIGGGLFASAFIIGLQGAILSVFGDQLFRSLCLVLQGVIIAILLSLILLFPFVSSMVPVLLQSGSAHVLWFPPFWFLGIYQCLVEGASAPPIFGVLARIGCEALFVVSAIAVLAYPIAYRRRVRELIEGSAPRSAQKTVGILLRSLSHAILARTPGGRAVFHFINQTVLRVPRYRTYLVLYGGVGLSVLTAAVLRLTVLHGQVNASISPDCPLIAIGIVPFWMIAGLCVAFNSPWNQKGGWIFRLTRGNPPNLGVAMEQLGAARVWVLFWSLVGTGGACLAFFVIAQPGLVTLKGIMSQIILAIGMCLLLTDLFFLNVKTVAFTGRPRREHPIFALTVLKYIVSVSVLANIPLMMGPWMEKSLLHLAGVAFATAAAHFAMRVWHHRIIRDHCSSPGLEDDEEEFPLKLGLHY